MESNLKDLYELIIYSFIDEFNMYLIKNLRKGKDFFKI